MRKKHILETLTVFTLTQCSSCNDKSSVSKEKTKPNEQDHITVLRSVIGTFPSRDHQEKLLKIVKDFSEIKNISKVDEAIHETTIFLDEILKKDGENINGKVDVAVEMAQLFIDKILKNCTGENSVPDFELSTLVNDYKTCLNQLLDIGDDFKSAFINFSEFSLSFGILNKMFETPAQLEKANDDIDRLFSKDCPINNMAIEILKPLSGIELDIFKSVHDKLFNLFLEYKDQEIGANTFESIVKNANKIILDFYKKLVLDSVVEKIILDFINSLTSSCPNLKFYLIKFITDNKIENVKVDLTDDNFIGKFMMCFKLFFDHQYELELEKDGAVSKIKFLLQNFDESSSEKFFSSFFDGDECALSIKNSGNVEGKTFDYICLNNKYVQKNGKLMLTDKLFYGTLTLYFRLSVGHDCDLLKKSVNSDASELLKDIGETFCFHRYGNVFNLLQLYKNAHNGVISINKDTSNKEIFHKLWTFRNVAYYISQSCDVSKYPLPADINDFVKKLLASIKEGQKDDANNVIKGLEGIDSKWNNFVIDTIAKNNYYPNIKLALAEYLVRCSGLFTDGVEFVTDGTSVKVEENSEMIYDGKNTRGVWEWENFSLCKQPICSLDDVISDNELDIFFGIDKSIPDCANIICDNVWTQYLDVSGEKLGSLQEFLNERNKFYSSYRQGIFDIKNKESLKNYLQGALDVAIKADDLVTEAASWGKDKLLLKGIVEQIVKNTYSGKVNTARIPILMHIETYLAPKQDSIPKHIWAYWVKFIENILDGSIKMPCHNEVKLYQSLCQIKSVKDVEALNLLSIANKNVTSRVAIGNGNPPQNIIHDYVSDEYGVGLNDVFASIIPFICDLKKADKITPKQYEAITNSELWKNRNPNFGKKSASEQNNAKDAVDLIDKWFDSSLIWIYDLLDKEKTFPKNKGDNFCKITRPTPRAIFVGNEPFTTADDLGKNVKDGPYFTFYFNNEAPFRNLLDEYDIASSSLSYFLSTVMDKLCFDCESKKSKNMDFQNMVFLNDLFGSQDCIGSIDITNNHLVSKPGFLFRFDYHGVIQGQDEMWDGKTRTFQKYYFCHQNCQL